MSRKSRRREGRKVHRNVYEGMRGELGAKELRRQNIRRYECNGNSSSAPDSSPTARVEESTLPSRMDYSGSSGLAGSFYAVSSIQYSLRLRASQDRIKKVAHPSFQEIEDFGCWWKIGEVLYAKADNDVNGLTRDEVTHIAPQVSKSLSSREEALGDYHLMVRYGEERFYVSIWVSEMSVELALLIAGAGGKRSEIREGNEYGKTDNPQHILGFKSEKF